MKAVVLAAGRGRRLFPYTRDLPKPLVPLVGIPLIEYVLSGLMLAGISHIVVVTGHKGSILENYFSARKIDHHTIEWVRNLDFQRGNGVSLACARRVLWEEPFILHMGDHLVDPEIVRRLGGVSGTTAASVDTNPRLEPQRKDATKVAMTPNWEVLKFGKRLFRFSGIDAGVFRCEPEVLETAHQLSLENYQVTVSEVMNRLIRDGNGVKAVDATDLLWLDMDTKRDLSFAETLMSGLQESALQDLGWDRLKIPQQALV
ncbi:MAG TPA: NTP transferase domain-containing protein [Candidatus Bathyarchaeia archaeon]